jgi:Ca2+-binding RTX toxin-like protein
VSSQSFEIIVDDATNQDNEIKVLIAVTEVGGKLNFHLQVIDRQGAADKTADLRGIYFHVSNLDLIGGFRVENNSAPTPEPTSKSNDPVPYTNIKQLPNGVMHLATGNNMEGSGRTPYDVAIEFGVQGIGQSKLTGQADDFQEVTFTLFHQDPSKSLSLGLISGQLFGVRLQSYGEIGREREGSLKLYGTAPGEQSDPGTAPGADADTSYDDLIEGGAGKDTIFGGRGNDEIQGEGGDDIIAGGSDNGKLLWGDTLGVIVGDNLYGNDGKDIFLYDKGDGVDLIWDFQPGRDVIRLRGHSIKEFKEEDVTFVRTINNRITTSDHDKIAVVLDKNGDAIIFNDYPNPRSNDIALQFDDGTISSAQLLTLAQTNALQAGALVAFDTINKSDAFTGVNRYGSNKADTLVGTAKNDRLYGNEGADVLIGNAGSDKLYGTGGADLIIGDEADGIVVRTSTSVTISDQALNVTATGNRNVKLIGNGLDNLMVGNRGKNIIKAGAGDDTLNGKLGKDVLTGSKGKDAFVFDTKLDGTNNIDRITDFEVKQDKIWLDDAVFTSLNKTGGLKKAFFTIGDQASAADDYIIYDKHSGALYYDADGNGLGEQVKFAQLTKNLKLTHKDLIVL